jgi:hypothetical protein
MFNREKKEKIMTYILEKKSGYRQDLVEEFGEDVVRELCMLGYITQGTVFEGNSHKRTWSITQKAKDFYLFFMSELTEYEKERGRYLHKIGV